MKKILSLLMFFSLLPIHLLSQVEVKKTTALKIDKSIKIDGALLEPAWDRAPEVGDFIQFQPQRGELSRLKTRVKILYNERFIYFGFVCHDSQPEKIVARVAKRDDDVKTDDAVYVLVDTYHDKRNCYFFGTNLLGTQRDGKITENGRTTDITWDGIWESAAQRTDSGWTAEIALALVSLKYEPGQNRSWGLSLGRAVPRFLEYSFWTGPLESTHKVSQFGELNGLDLKKAEKRAQVIPHIISKAEQGEKSEFTGGLDLRYAFSQMVSGNLTINPDFATVEADEEEINLTRFELFLPEKRNFFLEEAEIYQQRIRLFYSRRISDIYGGAKVYGKAGGYEYAAMNAQTKEDEPEGLDSANFMIFRLKKNVMESSTLGFIAANKLVNGMSRGTTGIDTSLYFTDTFKFTGQFALSYGDNVRDIAFFLRPSYDSATFHIHLRYTQLGEDFAENANEVGFIRDDNRRELDSAIAKTFWMKKGVFDRIQYESNYNIYWGMDRSLRSWKIDQELTFDLRSKFSLSAEHHSDFKAQDDIRFEEDFTNHISEFKLGYNTREWQHAAVSYGFGRNFNLDFTLIEGSLNYKISKNLSFEYSLTRLMYDPDPEGESTWIHILRATNSFTKDLYLRLFYQVNTSIDKENIQVLFVYRFQPPFGLIQLVYQKGTAAFGEAGTQGHTLFLKIAYMF